MRLARLIATLILGLTAAFIYPAVLVAEPLPRSVLILDQSTHFGPWPNAISAAVRSTVIDNPQEPVTVYLEHLDLFRFKGSRYENSLEEHFREKYRDKPIGVIVVIGPTALSYALRLRAALWPSVAIVFAAVDDTTAAEALPPNVTGVTMNQTLGSMIEAARIVVPDLKGFAIVGTPLEDQIYYRHFAEELPRFSRDLEFIDLMGLSLDGTRQRVAALPDHTAILYIGINFYGPTTYVAAEVVPLIAEQANRPIIVDAETFLGSGAVGGFILTPQQMGQDAGRLASRILQGEDASSIPVTKGGPQKAIFDGRQLQRWNVDASRLPPGSEIRFREPSAWDRYETQILAVTAAMLLQASLIAWLVHERQYRRRAERAARDTMSELTQLNRMATAGELSATIAHEVNQPLTGIVTRANAALRWLSNDNPELAKARDALRQIVTAGHHASDVVTTVRAMFRKDTQDQGPVDINRLIRSVLALVYIDLRKHSVETRTDLGEHLPPMIGNEVQLQQVILNLVMNAIEAMTSAEPRVLSIKSQSTERGTIHVLVEDTGSGIDPANLDRIFKPLFTTKAQGMGMGLSICRSIIESHHGRIWASAGASAGSIFQFELPTGTGLDRQNTTAASDKTEQVSAEPRPVHVLS
jgi:signal transduction histidine kinase